MLRFSACRMQDEFVNLDRILLHGGTAEDTDAAAAVIEDRQEGRRAAARARKDYDRALRSLNKVGGKNACVFVFFYATACCGAGGSTLRSINMVSKLFLRPHDCRQGLSSFAGGCFGKPAYQPCYFA